MSNITRYTTRHDAIECEIVAPIAEATNALTCSARVDYDIDAIADELVRSDETGYWLDGDVEDFWTVVADNARDDEEMIAAILADPTEAHEDGLPEGVVIDGMRAIIHGWEADDLGRECYVEPTWHNSEYGIQFGNGDRVCAETLGEADDAASLVKLIRDLADDGRTPEDRIAEHMQEHVNELVKGAPVRTAAKAEEHLDYTEPYLDEENRTVEVWWTPFILDGDRQHEIVATRTLTDDEFARYAADLAEDED